MASFAFVFLACLLPSWVSAKAVPSYELYDYDPVANTDATVTIQNARFTVLTDQLLRMEYGQNSKFEDRATLAFINRLTTVPTFTHEVDNGVLTITTKALKLTYKVGSAFSADTLKVTASDEAMADGGLQSQFSGWYPGKPNDANLLGTIKSLDQLGAESLNCTVNAKVTVHSEKLHCQWGLVSRDGWSVVDDSDNWGLTPGAEWWDSPNTDVNDWYLFAHGHDYKQAIADYTLVGGKVPVVPRYTLGVWFTRWFDFNNFGVKRLVNKYREKNLPMDVYVTDMNWHKKDNWGGWTFDPNLYPDGGGATFGWLHNQGITTAANLHDANGVGNYDKMFPQMCKAMGLDPQKTKTVPFSITNKTYVYALEDIVLGDIADKIDFMWIDWQQGGKMGGAAGGKQNPTIWTNKIRVTDPKRQGKHNRAIVLARWGGLGTHRYQVGFSGDVNRLTWQNLAYQPYFSLTSANVAYGFWSHDIEGPGDNPEMYVRWVQWAQYSGVLRSHERGMSAGGCAGKQAGIRGPGCSNVRPWEVPEKYFDPIREALVGRSEMVPYLYTAARAAFETGLGLLMPMYYEHPEVDSAYLAAPDGTFAQYYFGSSDVLVSPVTAAVDANTNLANRPVWLPPGTWVEQDTGAQLVSPSPNGMVHNKSYDLTEVPVFIRGGSVLPSSILSLGNTIGRAKQQYGLLAWSIYPGATSGSGDCYEDDADTDAYLQGNHATTTLTYTRASANTIAINIATNGTYPELPQSRQYQVNLVNFLAPTQVTINGASVKYSDLETGGTGDPSGDAWWYDGPEMTLRIRSHSVSVKQGLSIKVTAPVMKNMEASLSGFKGVFRHANLAKDNFDQTRSEPGAHNTGGGALSQLSSVGDVLSFYASKPGLSEFLSQVQGYKSMFDKAVAEVDREKGARGAYAQALMASAMN